MSYPSHSGTCLPLTLHCHTAATQSRKGHPVRVAMPNIVIQDVRHASAVDPSREGQVSLLALTKAVPQICVVFDV